MLSFLHKVYTFFLDIIQTLLIAVAVFLVIYAFFFRPYQITGSSMYPTFKDKEYVLTNLIVKKIGNFKQGDVVVFNAPTDAEKDFIKRIIGIPGDTININNGDLYVNNQKFDESLYLSSDVKTYAGAFLREGQAVTVPPEEYFVVGDNRPHSSDSREWGFVKRDAIIGKSLFVYWPVTKMRLVRNPFGK